MKIKTRFGRADIDSVSEHPNQQKKQLFHAKPEASAMYCLDQIIIL